MRRWRLFVIAVISFIGVTGGVFFQKILSLFLCGLLSFNSTVCYINFNDGRVNAAISSIKNDYKINIPVNEHDKSNPENFPLNRDFPISPEADFKLDIPLQIAIPPIIRPAEVNVYLQNALPKDFRISNQIPFRSGKQEILLVSPSTGAEQLYTFNLPGASSFQLFEVEYKKVSAIDFSNLTSTNSLVVNPEQIKSVLNKFKINFANNSLSKVTLSDGTTADFSAGQAVIKAPNGQQVETIQISQNEFIDNNIVVRKKRNKFSNNQSNNLNHTLLAKSSESSCQAAVSSSLNGISDNLGQWGNKLTTSNSATTKSIGWALAFGSGAMKSNISSKNPMLQEVNCRPPVQCEEKRVSGGSEIRTDLFQTAKGSSRKVNLEFEFYEIPDTLELYFDGEQIGPPIGPQPGHATKTFDLPDGAEYVGVKLIGNDNKNTRWWYVISCSGGSLEIIALDKWWATVGEKELPVTLTIRVPKKGKYSLNIDAENLPDWKLTDNAEVIINGKSKPFNSRRFGKVDLGELEAGEHKIKINSFQIPEKPIVEEITFELKAEDNSQEDKLVALFVADRSETGNYQALVNKYAPILYFDNGQGIENNPIGAEKYKIPYDVEQTTWLDKPKDYKKGDSTTVIDLSSYATNPRNNTSGKVYAAVVKHPTNGEVAINYYFHYPRSNWREHGGNNTHEGDWEGITVFLDKNLSPQRVSFAQHVEVGDILPNTSANRFGEGAGGQTARWSILKQQNMLENGRPKVYVGLGGHASYPHSWETSWYDPRRKRYFVESHRGNLSSPFDSKGKVQYLPRIGAVNAPEWLKYPGYWGNLDIFKEGDGDDAPRGPVFADNNIKNLRQSVGRGQRWLDPWEWSASF